MRLFAAVPVPHPAHDEIAVHLRGLVDEGWPVRWVPAAGLHITLKFFGEVNPDRLDTISEMIGFAVDQVPPIALGIVGGGAFPSREHPRVLRLDVTPSPALELLQDRIERGGERIGFPPEGRAFWPHITLGRVREGHRLPSGAMDRVEGLPAEPSFLSDRVVLFESELGPSGPRYVPRTEFVLYPEPQEPGVSTP